MTLKADEYYTCTSGSFLEHSVKILKILEFKVNRRYSVANTN
jgi:hypothetical protein